MDFANLSNLSPQRNKMVSNGAMACSSKDHWSHSKQQNGIGKLCLLHPNLKVTNVVSHKEVNQLCNHYYEYYKSVIHLLNPSIPLA